MKRYAVMLVLALTVAVVPSNAQKIWKQLGDTFLGGQGQQGQSAFIGNVNLPPGQYMMTNVQSGQAFYVAVQEGQMFFSQAPQTMAPGQSMFGAGQGMLAPSQGMIPGQQGLVPQQQQQGGVGGMIKGGLGNFLRNQMAPQQQAPAQY